MMTVSAQMVRIEEGWRWLCRHSGKRDWEERYERWLRWVAVIDPLPAASGWSVDMRAVMESFSPTFAMPPCDDLSLGLRACLYCGVSIWSGQGLALGQEIRKPHDGPLFLNPIPVVAGRWTIVAPGQAEWCRAIDLVHWPLPRFTSHLMTCHELIFRRDQEKRQKAEHLLRSKEVRAERRKERWQRVRDIVDETTS